MSQGGRAFWGCKPPPRGMCSDLTQSTYLVNHGMRAAAIHTQHGSSAYTVRPEARMGWENNPNGQKWQKTKEGRKQKQTHTATVAIDRFESTTYGAVNAPNLATACHATCGGTTDVCANVCMCACVRGGGRWSRCVSHSELKRATTFNAAISRIPAQHRQQHK